MRRLQSAACGSADASGWRSWPPRGAPRPRRCEARSTAWRSLPRSARRCASADLRAHPLTGGRLQLRPRDGAIVEWPNTYRVFRVYADRLEWEVRQVANRGFVRESCLPQQAMTWMIATAEGDLSGVVLLRRQ